MNFPGGQGEVSEGTSGVCVLSKRLLISLESVRPMFASNYASHLNELIMALVSALDKVENAIES